MFVSVIRSSVANELAGNVVLCLGFGGVSKRQVNCKP